MSLRVDQTYQHSSGISDLKRVLDEEENLDNVSDCSFLLNEQERKNRHLLHSNILDKGQFVMNSFQQHSMGIISQQHNQSNLSGMNASPLKKDHALIQRPIVIQNILQN